MATVHTIDINVNLINNAGAGLGGLNAVFAQLNQQSLKFSQTLRVDVDNSLNIVNKTILNMRQSAQNTQSAFMQMFLLHEAVRFGETTLGMFGGIIQSAADFETAMGNVRMATGATTAEMGLLGDAVIRISQTHAMDLTESAQMLAIASRGGVKDPKALLALLDPESAGIPMAGIADFADVMRVSQKMSVEQSTKMGMEFATLLGGQDPTAILSALDQFTRASQFSPEGPQALFQTFKKLHPLASTMGASAKQELQVSALLGESGLEGSGGREVASGLLKLFTAKPGQGAGGELDTLLTQGHKAGQPLDLLQIITQLHSFEKSHPDEALKAEKSAFGQVGLRAFAVLSDPNHIAQLEKMVGLWDKMPGLQEMHSEQMSQLNMVWKETTTDVDAFGAVLGGPLLPIITGALDDFNAALGAVTTTLNEHPVFKGIASANLGGAAAGAGAGFLGTIGLLVGKGLSAASAGVAAGTAAEGGLAAAGGAATAGGAALLTAAVPIAMVTTGALLMGMMHRYGPLQAEEMKKQSPFLRRHPGLLEAPMDTIKRKLGFGSTDTSAGTPPVVNNFILPNAVIQADNPAQFAQTVQDLARQYTGGLYNTAGGTSTNASTGGQ